MDSAEDDPSLNMILGSVTLYNLTCCASSNLWSYLEVFDPNVFSHSCKKWYINKPFGHAWFPRELDPLPKAWIETKDNPVFFMRHERGGHVAPTEQSRELWAMWKSS